jgi:transglutaminase-like putative cysteine protease
MTKPIFRLRGHGGGCLEHGENQRGQRPDRRGNINKPDAEGNEFNHAWVVAEAAPRKWIALETTGGYLVSGKKNKNYYRGYFFASPRELKEYLEAYSQGKGILKLQVN